MTRTLVCVWLFAGCATGGTPGNNGQDDAAVRQDAQHVTADAAVKHDAGVIVHDAFVPHDAPATPDAASALFCTANAQCTNAGECCVTLGGPSGFCAPGTIVLGQCVPQ